MNEAGREIAILSLAQVLAVAQDHIEDAKARDTLERHVRQVAAIIQGKANNKPDQITETLLSEVRDLLRAATAA